MLIKKSVHFTKLALLGYGLSSLYVQANQTVSSQSENAKQPIIEQVDLAQQIAEQTDVELIQQQTQQKIAELVGQYSLQFEPLLTKIYSENGFTPLWQDQKALKQFLREYSALVLSGVSKKSAASLEAIASAEPNSLAYDLLVTDAFLDYMYYSHHLLKSAQQWLYSPNAYRAKAPQEQQVEAWLSAVKNGDNFTFVQSLSSNNHLYQQTLDYLAEQLAQQSFEQTEKHLEISSTLRPGTNSPEVAVLIKMLKGKHLLPAQTPEQNDYSPEIVAAVKNLQEKNGLTPDGIVGNATRMVLNNPTGKALLYKLAINAQRLKVLPDFQNGLFVNVPSYQLQYYRDGELALTSRVIVGTNARKTPVMYSELSNLVVNPPWNAPVRLINEDIIPKVRQDPSYIYRNGYTIIDSKGRSIDPYTIDWENMTSKNFPYRLRQRPGDDSALGRYKFNMPSSDAIYLHDTPRKDLFSRKNRALSSGCVRVEKSDELATMLLNEAGWNETRKQNALASKQTTSVPIKGKHPVYLYYVTAWVDKHQVHQLPDIYHYDTTPNLNNINWSVISKFLLEN
ncbi:murein L,D-transpeptidase YcbB/YkuD [Volucribacter psittacicida]|uniref:Murein L,D-transpeptidase YcbB/YkuD n=1 Tax=Volucribacter psittacicida TaxID=203482 RepID=A0A4R1G5F3_9PAST|nr:L,D-transpeptidase family protein [Volucribacter psittacicida]TCK01665.1 murein L,D-transpeptidase YcbB/YkuD [Volucribacter psittacicida]